MRVVYIGVFSNADTVVVLTRTDRTCLVKKIQFGQHLKSLKLGKLCSVSNKYSRRMFLIIITTIHFIYTLKSKLQALFSSVLIVRSKCNIIQVKTSLNTYI